MKRFNRHFVVAGVTLAVVIGGVVGVLRFASGITAPSADSEVVQVEPLQLPNPVPTPRRPPDILPASNADPLPPAVADPTPRIQDELLRSMVAGLSSHPKLASWLVPDDLVRRFVSAVDAIAGGYSPRDDLDFMRPVHPFLVRPGDSGSLVIASGSFRRYDLAADVVESIDTDGAVRLFREIEPMLDEAHRAASWNDSPFEISLSEAVAHLLQTPVLGGQLAVERKMLSYAYADPELEGLSDAQRQLLRMGPGNARRVQAKLRELAAAFGWSTMTTGDASNAVPASTADEAAFSAHESILARTGTNPASEISSDVIPGLAEVFEPISASEPDPSVQVGGTPAASTAGERRNSE